MMELLNPPPVFIEIGLGSLKALCETRGLELPLERAADGKLTAVSREKIIAGLEKLIGRKSWQPRARAVCGLGAHGVLLRRIILPAAAAEDFECVLRLQIELEFPLSPDELAWGWRDISNVAGKREILVAAVRKKTVEDLSSILVAAGANPEFSIAALARDALCAPSADPHAVLEITSTHGELVTFENGVPGNVQVFPVGTGLAGAVQKNTAAKIIYVSGGSAMENIFPESSAAVACKRLEISSGEGSSAATLGLKKCVAENRPVLLLNARPQSARSALNLMQPENRGWLVRAAALLALLLLFPVAETLLVKPFLQWRLESYKTRQHNFLSVVEPERKFLLNLKQSQPPYLDALYIFSKSAPPGTHFDSITISQRGEISIKAAMANGQTVSDFRAKLMASGFFSSIVVEEQSPVLNQPRVGVRMTAVWKFAGLRPAVSVPLPAAATNKIGTNAGPAKILKS